jgi:hypothetical protein
VLIKINRLFTWIVDIWRWLAEGEIVFMCILVLAAAVMIGFFMWCSETSIRSTGYALQFLGMIFAIRGLLGVRSHFGQPPLRQLFVIWLKRFPKWKKSFVGLKGTVQAVSSLKAQLEVWIQDKADQTIEKRIEGIVKNLDRIRKEQGEHTKSIEELKDSLGEHKKKVADDSKKMDEKLRKDLESLHTSDLITSLVGLVWLIAGISMSTMAPELLKLLY